MKIYLFCFSASKFFRFLFSSDSTCIILQISIKEYIIRQDNYSDSIVIVYSEIILYCNKDMFTVKSFSILSLTYFRV